MYYDYDLNYDLWPSNQVVSPNTRSNPRVLGIFSGECQPPGRFLRPKRLVISWKFTLAPPIEQAWCHRYWASPRHGECIRKVRIGCHDSKNWPWKSPVPMPCQCQVHKEIQAAAVILPPAFQDPLHVGSSRVRAQNLSHEQSPKYRSYIEAYFGRKMCMHLLPSSWSCGIDFTLAGGIKWQVLHQHPVLILEASELPVTNGPDPASHGYRMGIAWPPRGRRIH